MYRSIFTIGLFLVIYSIIGLITPHGISYLTFLFPDGIAAVSGMMLGLLLCNFAVASYLRKPLYKILFVIMSIALIFTTMLGIIKPTYFGALHYNIRPADLLVFTQASIGLLIAAFEYYRPSFQAEVGIPYRHYLRFILAKPTMLLHSFKKRVALAVTALETGTQQ